MKLQRRAGNFLKDTGKFLAELVDYKETTKGAKKFPCLELTFEVLESPNGKYEDALAGQKINMVVWITEDGGVSGKNTENLNILNGEEVDIGDDYDIDEMIGTVVYIHTLGKKDGEKEYANIERIEEYDEDDEDDEPAPKKKKKSKKSTSKKKSTASKSKRSKRDEEEDDDDFDDDDDDFDDDDDDDEPAPKKKSSKKKSTSKKKSKSKPVEDDDEDDDDDMFEDDDDFDDED